MSVIVYREIHKNATGSIPNCRVNACMHTHAEIASISCDHLVERLIPKDNMVS